MCFCFFLFCNRLFYLPILPFSRRSRDKMLSLQMGPNFQNDTYFCRNSCICPNYKPNKPISNVYYPSQILGQVHCFAIYNGKPPYPQSFKYLHSYMWCKLCLMSRIKTNPDLQTCKHIFVPEVSEHAHIFSAFQILQPEYDIKSL